MVVLATDRVAGAVLDNSVTREPSDSIKSTGSAFFRDLPASRHEIDTFDPARYGRAPDDWHLVVTDIADSTGAVASGRHKTVNFVAATAIAALENLCAPSQIPFLFGGDGAVVMVPPEFATEAKVALARVRGFAAREFEMNLRVGMVPVAAVRRFGADVSVGRYEPSPGNAFGLFLGGGVGLLEAAVKGRGFEELGALATIPELLDDGEAADLTGLSCRWDALSSMRGKMVAVIIQGAAEPGKAYAAVIDIAGEPVEARAVRPENLRARWPPTGIMLEARARRAGGSLARSVLRVLGETLLARIIFASGRPVGSFDPERYRKEVGANTDFCRYDEMLCFVMDCPADRIEAVREYLDRCTAQGTLRYGMHVSDTALMTCFVTSLAAGRHVHFVDGGGGGYTIAAKSLKIFPGSPVVRQASS